MSNNPSTPWSPEDRALLDSLLDTIIPAGQEGKLPAAGALGIAEFLAERVVDTEGIGKAIASVLAASESATEARGNESFQILDASVREEIAKEVEAKLPEAFKALVIQTYMGYYVRPEVTVHFGTGPKPPQPDGHDLPMDDPEELKELTEPVRSRGNCYREC
jgi:hypothetical protein